MNSPHNHDHRATAEGEQLAPVQAEWNPYPPTQAAPVPAPSQPSHAGQGMHKWMMALMCVPLVLLGLWTLINGGGGGGLIGGLLCMGMMMVMHQFMGGHGKGGGHQH